MPVTDRADVAGLARLPAGSDASERFPDADGGGGGGEPPQSQDDREGSGDGDDGDSEPKPGAGVGTCGHNDWDHIRSASKKAHLRCRVCQSRVAVVLSSDAYKNRCKDFRRQACDERVCPKLHVHREKQRLDVRHTIHGSRVLRPLAPAHQRALNFRYAHPTNVNDTQPDFDDMPLPEEEEGSPSAREMDRRAKVMGDILKARSRAGLRPLEGPVPDAIRFFNACPQLRAPGQRSAPVSVEVADADLAGVWCSEGRYFHPDTPPPYAKCSCRAEPGGPCEPPKFREPLGSRFPCLFLSQPWGPSILTESSADLNPVTCMLKNYIARLPGEPVCVVAMAADWMCNVCTVSTATDPQIVYDFPPAFDDEAGRRFRPTPRGSPEFGSHVAGLLSDAGIKCNTDASPNMTHGVWVPLKVMCDDLHIPVVQLSIASNLSVAHHVQIGKALAPLRDQNVLIIGSGSTYRFPRAWPKLCHERALGCLSFDTWLHETLCDPRFSETQREDRLRDWRTHPSANSCHPRGGEEYLMPLMTVFGASAGGPCCCPCDVGCRVTHLVFSCFEWL
eukprot:TRINITY_DN2309_c0_g1_i1.p1 TRINITY_DN2309_c0_g1~~TRINITY_DN2309_c0_g1_i1.p1  ORF type:complete len:581 (+),score=30.15 TRINITY_DN2309_c0_g1_i1:63-1745(+)